MGLSDYSGAPMSERINARLSQPLAEFVERMVGEAGLYETPSEYVRDLIRRDMERREGQSVQDAILAGYRDVAAGRVVAAADQELLDAGGRTRLEALLTDDEPSDVDRVEPVDVLAVVDRHLGAFGGEGLRDGRRAAPGRPACRG